jgi:hypothetical protein
VLTIWESCILDVLCVKTYCYITFALSASCVKIHKICVYPGSSSNESETVYEGKLRCSVCTGLCTFQNKITEYVISSFHWWIKTICVQFYTQNLHSYFDANYFFQLFPLNILVTKSHILFLTQKSIPEFFFMNFYTSIPVPNATISTSWIIWSIYIS